MRIEDQVASSVSTPRKSELARPRITGKALAQAHSTCSSISTTGCLPGQIFAVPAHEDFAPLAGLANGDERVANFAQSADATAST